MNTALKLAGFGIGLVVVFAAATGLGAAVGPSSPSAPPARTDDHGGSHGPADISTSPAGLQVSEDGYTLALDSQSAPAAAGTDVTFRLLGPDGSAVTDYADSHGEDPHLVAVRRDLSGFQHVHPVLDEGGSWRATLDLTPGSWRLLADSTPAGGGNRVLGADLEVAGTFEPVALPTPSATAEIDGYTVVRTGELTAGRATELTFSVSRGGVPVTDLQPYLGSTGHVVFLRAGDLAYLPVHPGTEAGGAEPTSGPHVRFVAETPSAGTYRLFLDFRHGDAVHTAVFTSSVPAPTEEAGS